MKTNYPNLDEFFGTYFHQDWLGDAPTATGIVKNYLAEWPAKEVVEANAELTRLLAVTETTELALVLRQFGCYYNPSADGLSCREWLEQVSKMLSASESALGSGLAGGGNP